MEGQGIVAAPGARDAFLPKVNAATKVMLCLPSFVFP